MFVTLLGSSDGAYIGTGIGVYVVLLVLWLAGMWRVFVKGNRPGWAAIIPFFNIYTLLKVVGRPGWWLILYLIPVVNLVVNIIVSVDLARSFGKSAGYAVGIFLLPFIFFPILGFGSARYAEPWAAGPRAI